jgi:hypothetical protein
MERRIPISMIKKYGRTEKNFMKIDPFVLIAR